MKVKKKTDKKLQHLKTIMAEGLFQKGALDLISTFLSSMCSSGIWPSWLEEKYLSLMLNESNTYQ